MDKLRAIKLFVRLADLASFTKVAEEINSSKSMVSKEISRLEKEIGARLIHRSTRNLQLTHVGEGYLQRCREILLKLDDAEAFVQDMQNQPRGKLRINIPMALGLTDLGKAFAEFMQVYPDIELDVHLGDEFIDLIEHGFDLGFRALSYRFDCNYIGKSLINFSYQICASPAYLKAHPKITTAQDLQHHNCFVYSYFPSSNTWPIDDGINIKGTLRVNSTIFMMEAIKSGLGVGFIPEFVCKEALANGDVVEIIPLPKRPKLTLYALYPARQFVPPKLSKFIEFLEDWFKNGN